MKTGNDIVNYWASLGLFISRNELKAYKNELMQILDKIDYLPAKLYLAGSLYDSFGDKASKEILEEGMLSDNIYVNKQTMQILLNIDLKKAQDLLPAVHKHIELYGKLRSHVEVEDLMNVVLLRLENKEYRFGSFF